MGKEVRDSYKPENIRLQIHWTWEKIEPEARRIFIEKTGKHVIEVGLVVSRQNPWLAVSPDGVIFENGAPVEVLEIKCPFKGAQMNIKDAIDKEFKQCLDVRGEKYVLKQGNKYYGQVQLNMAVLNVKRASFAMWLLNLGTKLHV